MKNQKNFELPQYGGVVIASIVLFAVGLFSFNIWYLLSTLLMAVIFFTVLCVAEKDSYGVEVKSNNSMRLLLSGFLFLVLWSVIQLMGGIFWCFLVGAVITVFFHMFRLPLYILLFDYECDEEGFVRSGEDNLTKSEVVFKAFKDEDFIDWFFPYNWGYIGIFAVYMLIGWIALSIQAKDEKTNSRTENTSSTGIKSDKEADAVEFYKATTVKVLNQIEDNNTVYYIITSKDTLRCKHGNGAIYLKPEGGDKIKYRLKENTKKQIEELVIR